MVQIRAATETDLPQILTVHECAFGQPQEAQLVAMLHRARKAAVSLVALQNGKVVGSVVFSPVTIGEVTDSCRGLGLAPVGVLPELHRRGIGSALIREGLNQCALAGYSVVVVLGDPRYYSRFGFSSAAGHGLGNEYGVYDEFMVVELRDGMLNGVNGVVRYVPEFRIVD